MGLTYHLILVLSGWWEAIVSHFRKLTYRKKWLTLSIGRLGCCVVFVLSEVQTPFDLETVWIPYIPQRSERGIYIEARHIFVTDD